MLVREVMTESVVTAPADATVRDVAELMRERNVGSVVLVSDGEAVGFLTDRDLTVSVLATGGSGSGAARRSAASIRARQRRCAGVRVAMGGGQCKTRQPHADP